MFAERSVVDNRTFLLGLDKLYRDAMKRHERAELLNCARRVAAALNVGPASVPVEGYYTESDELAEYFRLMRALQTVSDQSTPTVASLPEFHRLVEVTSAPLYGESIRGNQLLPTGRDPLSKALYATRPEWSLPRLVETAYETALETDDFSLVGLAARIKDAVVLAAMRESVVLYAQMVELSAAFPRRPKYVWDVDRELARQARRFIDTFNTLFHEKLPPPEPASAESYWHACDDNEIVGRCVRLGYNDAVSPVLHYHWAICRGNSYIQVQEFWHSEPWTTQRYRSNTNYSRRCPDLSQLGAVGNKTYDN
ncbi:MAG TPA: hypothetical protein VJM12_09380 [Pyrinomonadaceae bacterium]|nr:hypothetical protein [Pyrinomonadaceae bacterium]